MNTKLIMIEGIPGSGKSTFAKRITEFYEKKGITVNLYNEGGFHPADLAWNACIPIGSLESVLAKYSSFRDEIDKNMQIEGEYAIIPYLKIKKDDKEFCIYMENYEVYGNRVSFEVFNDLHYKRWSSFGRQANEKDELNVFECAFLQNHVDELRLFHLADLEMMKNHCNRLIQTVSDLSPILIYLSQPNIRETIERVAKERAFPDGSWIDMIINYGGNTPYGKLYPDRKGFDGVILGYEERQQAEIEIIKSLPITTLILDNPDYDWEELWLTLKAKLPL